MLLRGIRSDYVDESVIYGGHYELQGAELVPAERTY
jgi:hypothetical protein